MSFDVVLPSVLFFLTAASVFLYPKLEKKVKALVEERKFRMRDVALLVVLMGVVVTVLVFIPQDAILAIFLMFYSIALFTFVYSAVGKWYMGLILPAVFLLLYFFFWGTLQMDLFAAIFVVFVSVYVSTFFEWKTLAVFAGLLTIMDVVQVYGTKFMVESSFKTMSLNLPVAIIVPSFPRQGTPALGLGDFFLSGLLAIQTVRRYGRKFALASIAVVAVVFLIFGAIQIWYYESLLQQGVLLVEAQRRAAMPATVFIVCGWLVALGIRHAYNWLTSKK